MNDLQLKVMENMTVNSGQKLSIGIKLHSIENQRAEIEVGLFADGGQMIFVFPVMWLNIGDAFTVGGLNVIINLPPAGNP